MTKADLIAVIAELPLAGEPKRQAVFKVSKELRERVNQGRADLVSNANPTIPPTA